MNEIKLDNKILVIGPGSLTGSRFIELLNTQNEIYGAGGEMDATVKDKLTGFDPLDITNSEQVLECVKKFPGKYVINFAGATLVDEIEKTRPQDYQDISALEQNIAYKVNVIGTKNLIKACQENGKFPIFISTGFVFDGENGPYSEEDPIASDPNKVSWYAWTKVLAENAVAESGIEHLNIRLSYPFRSEYEGKTDFARSMLKVYDDYKSGKRDSIYPIFSDQTLTPTLIDDIPEAVAFLIKEEASGTFNLGSPEITSPYEFCCELLRVARNVENPKELIKEGSIVEFQKSHPELAKRPVKGGENMNKIISLGFIPTAWKEGIQKAFGK
jgi:dTDP-4-dehydrorhamnose reductase